MRSESVKQRAEANDAIQGLEINALLPHRLAVLCEARPGQGHPLSTIASFPGAAGNIARRTFLTPKTSTGATKYLGEPGDKALRDLRTSFIGRELTRKTDCSNGSSRSAARQGYTKAIFFGVYDAGDDSDHRESACDPGPLRGLSCFSEPISKFDLLTMIRDALGLTTEIEPYDEFQCDRSLDSSRFRGALAYRPPGWKAMVEELAQVFEERGDGFEGKRIVVNRRDGIDGEDLRHRVLTGERALPGK